MAKNTALRFIYQHSYDTIAQQMGKMDTLFAQVMNEGDLDKAIALAWSMRGHVACILKELHLIRREERMFAKYREGTNNG